MTKERTYQVSDLHNSLKFGLHSVTLIEEDDCYRLVVRNFGETLFSKVYPTIGAAHAAFEKNFGGEGLQPHWTDFFDPQYYLDGFELYIINQERMME